MVLLPDLKKTSSMVVTEIPRFKKSRLLLFCSRDSNKAGKFLDSFIGKLNTISPLAVLRRDDPWIKIVEK